MYNMHLIINTHWDREYRWPFKETQLRLAEAVDDLIDIMQRDEKFTYFHTDSQASMLEDYLEIRPERSDELKALVASGRIQTGPWYTLPAEFLVSGEALVRNLLLGHRIAKGLGNVMKAAYNIFSWGQVSQLPQIYRQFGMDTIVFYRGVDQSTLESLEFLWKAPDGTEALGITFGSYHRLNFWKYVYLPYIFGKQDKKDNGHCVGRDDLGTNGYLFNMCDENTNDLNHWVINQPCARDLDAALEGMQELIKTVKDKSSVDDLLFLQGFDQECPDPIITELLERLNENIDYGTIGVSSLPEYFKKVKETLEQQKAIKSLPVKEGEMLAIEKVGDAFGPLYNGVFSARMPLKVLNSHCQNLMESWAEPVSVWGKTLGSAYPTIAINEGWKELLKNQQHDGIGGCHVDRITETMIERYSVVKDIGESLTRDSLKHITGQIDFFHIGEREIGIVVFNSTQFQRSEVIIATLDIPSDWGFRKAGAHYLRDISIELTDTSGNIVPSQVLSIEEDSAFGYLKFGNVVSFDVSRVTIAFNAENISPNGYSTFTARPQKKIERSVGHIGDGMGMMENEYLKISINPNGTLSAHSKETGKDFHNLHYFEDVGEKGGPLIHSELFEKGLYNTLSSAPTIELVQNGPLYTKYRITHNWELPEALDSEIKVHVPHGSEWIDNGQLKRSKIKKVVTIQSEIILRKGSRKVEFKTVVDNTICDHRLRVLFPSGMSGVKECITDSPFDIVKRPIAVPDSTGWYEGASRTWPTQFFVALKEGNTAFAVVHKGISEYEVSDTQSRNICMTLLRAFRTAGNPTEAYRYQELAQCQGEHTFDYALLFGDEDLSPTQILSEAKTFNASMRVAQTTRHTGLLESKRSFFEVSDPRFVITAVKEDEEQKGVAIRGFNAFEEAIDMDVTFNFPVVSVVKSDLEENERSALDLSKERSVSLHVGEKEIVTLLVSL